MNIINLEEYSQDLYFIGGIVRDKLLNKKNFDIDITYVGNAIELSKKLNNIEILQINEAFGTVKVLIDGKKVDIASTRSEIYPKVGHLPQVEKIGCSLKEDVVRRDFTVNSLAMSLKTGEIIDYVDGLKDLKNKKLRVLHDKSFIEDPTRIIRGLKFAVRFGFELDEYTKKLQDDYLRNINYDMSYKRVKDEIVSVFDLNSQLAFEKFINEKIYKLITKKDFELPKINIEKLIKKYPPKMPWLVYVGIIDIEKFELTKTEKKIVEDYKSLIKKDLIDDWAIYQAFSSLELESLLMYAISKNLEIVERYLKDLKFVKLDITGSDLIKLGLKPSEKFSQCLNFVLQKKLQCRDMSKKDELQLAKEYFNL